MAVHYGPHHFIYFLLVSLGSLLLLVCLPLPLFVRRPLSKLLNSKFSRIAIVLLILVIGMIGLSQYFTMVAYRDRYANRPASVPLTTVQDLLRSKFESERNLHLTVLSFFIAALLFRCSLYSQQIVDLKTKTQRQ